MDIIRPTAIGPAQLMSSNIMESDHPAYSAGATYASGDRIIYAHSIYESIQNANVGHTPPAVLKSDAWWSYISADNRWAMFDDKVGSQSSHVDSIQITLSPGEINSIALLKLDATDIHIELSVDGQVLYTHSFDLSTSYITDYFAYFFEPVTYKKSFITLDLPIYTDCTVAVSINNYNGVAKCGHCVFGLSAYLGKLTWGGQFSGKTYSTIEFDQFGEYNFVQRANAKKMTCKIDLQSSDVDDLDSLLSNYFGVPLVFYGSDLFTVSLIYGIFQDYDIVTDNLASSTCNLSIQGFI